MRTQTGVRRARVAVDAAAPSGAPIAARLMPLIRGKISRGERKVGHFTDAPEVLEFVEFARA